MKALAKSSLRDLGDFEVTDHDYGGNLLIFPTYIEGRCDNIQLNVYNSNKIV